MNITRRDMGRMALAALPATRMGTAKPMSKFAGVQVGVNIPYSFGRLPSNADQILGHMAESNVSAAELRMQPIEAFLGAPALAARGAGMAVAPPRGQKGPLDPKQESEQKAAVEELRKWRLARPLSDFKAFRKKYEDAGVLIEIVKFDGINTATDDIVDYCFQASKALGAYAISCEIPVSQTKRLGQFAAKHKMMVGYHGHGNLTNPEAFGRLGAWEQAFWYSKYNGANVDIGHFFASNGFSPAEWIQENHTRVTHVHLKDRKKNNGPGMAWGEGDTPVKEILLMMRDRKYKFQATIELEYKIPEGSTAVKEIGRCVEYCRKVLES